MGCRGCGSSRPFSGFVASGQRLFRAQSLSSITETANGHRNFPGSQSLFKVAKVALGHNGSQYRKIVVFVHNKGGLPQSLQGNIHLDSHAKCGKRATKRCRIPVIHELGHWLPRRWQSGTHSPLRQFLASRPRAYKNDTRQQSRDSAIINNQWSGYSHWPNTSVALPNWNW